MNKLKTLLTFLCCMAGMMAWAIDVPSYTIASETNDAQVTTLIVHYESMNADCTGTEIVSGLISFPSSLKARAIILESHHTMTDNAEVPTVKGETASAILFRSSYCVVAPDFLGYGLTKDKAHPYICHTQNAANTIDLAIVARDIIASRGIKLEADALFNVGYSQGGGVSMAVHRALDTNEELRNYLHFWGSWCGAGPYDVKATLEQALTTNYLALPVVLPLVIKGFLCGFPQCFAEGRTVADFFSPALNAAGIEKWVDDKNRSTDKISRLMLNVTGDDHNPTAFLSEEMLRPDSPLRQELAAVAEADVLFDGWTRQSPVTLVHEPTDEVVPFINTQNAIAALGLDPDLQECTDLGYTHAEYGLVFYLVAGMYIEEAVKAIINGDDTPNRIDRAPVIIPDAPMYDLQGRPATPDHRGIVIQNGRLMLR